MIQVIGRTRSTGHAGHQAALSGLGIRNRAVGDHALAIAQHVVLALILIGVLVCQARSLAIVLRRRRAMPTQRPQRVTDLVWIAIPLVAVLFLAVRTWILALDVGAPAAADPTLDPR